MIANSNHIDFLIARYLSGEATRSEMQQLEQWMEASEVNKKYFEGIRFVHDKTVASHKIEKFDVDAAWKSLHIKMHEEKPVKTKEIAIGRSIAFRIAASILALISISALVYYFVSNKVDNTQILISSNADSVVTQTLADYSEVSLNKNSKLTYSASYGKTNREVTLSGEAFFDVNHDSIMPFVVKTKNTLIKDIGTSFNVKANENSDTIEVIVESGEVAFYTEKNPGIILNKGERGIYIKSLDQFIKSTISDPNVSAYATKVFDFNDCRLIDAINKINAVYGTYISLSQSNLSECRITVRFENETIENIAFILAETLSLKPLKTPGGYVLTGESCNNRP